MSAPHSTIREGSTASSCRAPSCRTRGSRCASRSGRCPSSSTGATGATRRAPLVRHLPARMRCTGRRSCAWRAFGHRPAFGWLGGMQDYNYTHLRRGGFLAGMAEAGVTARSGPDGRRRLHHRGTGSTPACGCSITPTRPRPWSAPFRPGGAGPLPRRGARRARGRARPGGDILRRHPRRAALADPPLTTFRRGTPRARPDGSFAASADRAHPRHAARKDLRRIVPARLIPARIRPVDRPGLHGAAGRGTATGPRP